MQTFSHTFTTYRKLVSFIEETHLNTFSNLLICYFSGIIDISTNQQLIHFLQEKLPNSILIGSTTDGEISGDCVLRGSIVISFTTFESSKISLHQKEIQTNNFSTGYNLGLIARENNAKLAILLSDGIYTNGEELINGFSSVAPNIVIAGGMAGDNGAFNTTYTFINQTYCTKCVVMLLISGKSLRIKTQHSFNWMPIGPMLTVTKAIGNRVYSIDNQTTESIYKKYLGEDAVKKTAFSGIEFPLILHSNGLKVGRSPLQIYDDGSLLFAGTIADGEKVRLGLGHINNILIDVNVYPKELAAFEPETIFIFSCTARRRFLGDLANIELQHFPAIASTVGFFTYGEFYHDEKSGKNLFFNETMTLLALSESPINNDTQIISSDQLVTPIPYAYPFKSTFNALVHFLEVTSLSLNEFNDDIEKHIDIEITKKNNEQTLLLSQSRLNTMNELLDIITHQWRQPLMNMTMITSALSLKSRLNLLDNTTFTHEINLLESQILNLSQIIESFKYLLTFNEAPVSTSFIEISTILQSLLGSSMKNSAIEFSLIIARDTTLILPKNELIQVVLSIIQNAKDIILSESIDRGVIALHFDIIRGTNKAYLVIQDNGGGISKDNFVKIFEPYFSTHSKMNGKGLGLFIAKKIVEKQLLGTISVENTSEGASFRIEFPINTTLAI